MIKTTQILMDEFKEYKDPKNKIRREVDSHRLFPLVKGLYEDRKDISPYLLSIHILNPSYLSFEYALSRYGMIPEMVFSYTSASFGKNKKKIYQNAFGTYSYRDVPDAAFPYGIKAINEDGYTYLLASKEKAICDTLYSLSPVANQKELEQLLFENLRIDFDEFEKINKNDVDFLATKYHSRNVTMLSKYLRRKHGNAD